MRSDADRAVGAVEDLCLGAPIVLETSICIELRAQGSGVGFAGHRDDFRLPAQDLLVNRVDIRARGERRDLETVRITFDNAERAAADRAGGTEDGDALHAEWSDP